MNQEIERKFLVQGDFKATAFSATRLVQGYLCRVPERTVRVRIAGDKGFITIKGVSDLSGISRFEWEKEISLLEAQALLKLCEKGVIDKTRYLVHSGKHVFEIDEFAGNLRGLVMAEVELSDVNETFVKPSFIGREVTGDPRYYNAYLSQLESAEGLY